MSDTSQTNDLVIGTHGRSIFKVNMASAQQLTPLALDEPLVIFDLAKTKFSKNWGRKQPWQKLKEPSLPVVFYASHAGAATWTVKTKDGLLLNNGRLDCVKGLNKFTFALDLLDDVVPKYQKSLSAADLKHKKTPLLQKADSGKYYLQKGTFVLAIEKEGKMLTKEFVLD